MTKQLQWIIGGLALLIVGFVALQIYLFVDMQRFKEKHASPEPKTETKTEQPSEQVQVPEVDKRPPPPDDGREYVWHGDHWAPVDSPHAHTPKAPPVVEEGKTYDGALTYHAELLETYPSEALALQCEERGHWSAKWIKDYAPPDDHVAQAFAKAVYLNIYYRHLRLTTGDREMSKEATRWHREVMAHMKSFDAYQHLPESNPGGRVLALMTLAWPLDEKSIVVRNIEIKTSEENNNK